MITPLPSGTDDSSTLGASAAELALSLGSALELTALGDVVGEDGAELVAGVDEMSVLTQPASATVPPPTRVIRPAAFSRVRRSGPFLKTLGAEVGGSMGRPMLLSVRVALSWYVTAGLSVGRAIDDSSNPGCHGTVKQLSV